VTISLTPDSVPADASYGTTVGTLSEGGFFATSYTILFNASNLFAVASPNHLVTNWKEPPTPGIYGILMFARGASLFQFDLSIVSITIIEPSAPKIGLDLAHVVTVSQPTPAKPGP